LSNILILDDTDPGIYRIPSSYRSFHQSTISQPAAPPTSHEQVSSGKRHKFFIFVWLMNNFFKSKEKQ